MSPTKKAVLLVNLGTPDAPEPAAIRRFLKAFLSDPRVIEVPRLVWFFVLRLLILPFRPRQVAAMYQSIWHNGSPQLIHGQALAKQLAAQIHLPVELAMTYGNPSLENGLKTLLSKGVEQLLVVPLFPQYSATTTAATWDALQKQLASYREIPDITFVKDYWQQPSWQEAIAASVQRFQENGDKPDKLLFSFHGIPQAYETKGDHYPQRCRDSAKAIAERLGLQRDEWEIAFQSRFGAQPWVTPYTDKLLLEWAEQGIGRVQVVCPGFSLDCLETEEEIAQRNHNAFLEAGGKQLEYIPALNATQGQLDWLTELVNQRI